MQASVSRASASRRVAEVTTAQRSPGTASRAARRAAAARPPRRPPPPAPRCAPAPRARARPAAGRRRPRPRGGRAARRARSRRRRTRTPGPSGPAALHGSMDEIRVPSLSNSRASAWILMMPSLWAGAGARAAGLSARNTLDPMLVALTVAVAVAASPSPPGAVSPRTATSPRRTGTSSAWPWSPSWRWCSWWSASCSSARGEKPEQGTVIFVAYLLGARSRRAGGGFPLAGRADPWGSVTVSAGAVVLAVLEVRLYDIWGG